MNRVLTFEGFYIEEKKTRNKVVYNVLLKDRIEKNSKGILKNYDSVILETFNKLEDAQEYCKAYQGMFNKSSDFEWFYSSYRFMPTLIMKDEGELHRIMNLMVNKELYDKDIQLLLYVYISHTYNKLVEYSDRLEQELACSCGTIDFIFVNADVKNTIVNQSLYTKVGFRCLCNANLFVEVSNTAYELKLIEIRKKSGQKVEWVRDKYLYLMSKERDRYIEVADKLKRVGIIIPRIEELGGLKIKS